MKRINHIFLQAIFFFHFAFIAPDCPAQHYSRTDTIPVKANSAFLKNPWAGGHNFCQYSDIDLDLDGIKDLFVFDRTGNKITTFLNGGTSGIVDYKHAPQYETKFPAMENFALMIDYNCDGKEDIFTYNYVSPFGMSVYKNISTTTLQFALVKQSLRSDYNPLIQTILISAIGVPAIEDIDNDGDLDILFFTPGSWEVDYHVNQSIELGYGCDSLIFKKDPPCWGHFTETASNCSAVLTSCRLMGSPGPKGGNSQDSIATFNTEGSQLPLGRGAEGANNGGSCLLCLDMDGDNDKELYLGQLGCCTGTLLTNGGSAASANMNAVTSNFPSGSTPINLGYFPCGYFADVNNDSKRDLIVSASSPNTSLNNESAWYYENTGADNTPVFSRKTRKFLQEEMIDMGEGADPAFFDFDSDGLTDLLVATNVMKYDSCPTAYNYNVAAYKNTGTATSPQFELTSTDYANLSAQLISARGKHLTFGDVDADGDEDMFVGDYSGFIHYFENTALTGNPANFVLSGPVNFEDANGDSIDIGSYSAPQLIDADRDGDLDLVIGELSGNLNYYRNIGTPASPSYSFVTSSFGGVDVMTPCCTGYSIPFIYDSAGSYRMIVASEGSRSTGNQQGWIWFYKNIDGNLSGNFTLVDSMYHNIWEGIRMAVTGKDITNDGMMDLVIGNYSGGLGFYLGDTLTTSISEIDPHSFDFTIYPNPCKGEFEIGGLKPGVNSLKLFNLFGELLFEKTLNGRSEVIQADLPNGIYFCEIRSGKYSRSKKLVILK